ncbi:MAG: 30S ribosomal protein S6 [Bdellovibrionaceae bacterium]|nr:30S ribosomal protein S6 [Pseudobdellovibrionaceae bacterium]
MFEITQETVVRPYEAIILMDANSSEEEQKALFQKNKGIIESFSGQIAHVDTWGSRKLGNPIEKASRGIYFHCTFTASPASIMELERTMRNNEKVLRFMHTRLPDGTSLTDYVEKFKEGLIERREREAKKQAAKSKRPMK